jgi:hypothetical protein
MKELSCVDGCIAKIKVGEKHWQKWEGTYSYHGSYPSALGSRIWFDFHKNCRNTREQTLEFIDQWTVKRQELASEDLLRLHPYEDGSLLDYERNGFVEWVYVLTLSGMRILRAALLKTPYPGSTKISNEGKVKYFRYIEVGFVKWREKEVDYTRVDWARLEREFYNVFVRKVATIEEKTYGLEEAEATV